MGAGTVEWLAIVGGIVAAACALACAVACAWLARAAQRLVSEHPRLLPGQHVAPPLPMVVYGSPQPAPQPPPIYLIPPVSMRVQQPQPMPTMTYAPAPNAPHGYAPLGYDAGGTRGPVVLEGHYPQLGQALGTWLQSEADPVERTRIARDLGGVGGADSARALLDGVRTGAITPTIAADNLERGGFEAGIAVAAALRDPEPRVRELASTLVGRCNPLEPAGFRPMPTPPPDPARRAT
ncbi:MAG: hypothetical protein JWM86_1323 [Thermoleophilia bacterium]|nr:hypothetical protein [Thermoleophilia bacterium]